VSHVALLIVKERFRTLCRNVLLTVAVAICLATLAVIASATHPHGSINWGASLFVGIVVGVPAGLIFYSAYRFLRFTFGRY